MPFMNEPPGARISTSAVLMYGRTVRALRNFTKTSLEREPFWRARGPQITTGYASSDSAASEGSPDD